MEFALKEERRKSRPGRKMECRKAGLRSFSNLAVKSLGKRAWKKAAEQAGRGHRNTCWQASPMPQRTGGDSPGCFRDLFHDLHNQNKKGKRGGGEASCKERNQRPKLRREEWQKHGRQNEKRQSVFHRARIRKGKKRRETINSAERRER